MSEFDFDRYVESMRTTIHLQDGFIKPSRPEGLPDRLAVVASITRFRDLENSIDVALTEDQFGELASFIKETPFLGKPHVDSVLDYLSRNGIKVGGEA